MNRIVLTFALTLSVAVFACAAPTESPAPPEATTASTAEALTTVKPGPNKVYGIDVSHFQGTINWASEKAQGRRFGVASVGDGLYQDPTFATNWAAMKAAGVIRGAYQYFEPGQDPVAQANIVIARVGHLGAGDLPVMLDVEVTGGQSAATIASHVGKWLARVEAGTGRTPMIYTGPYFWQDHVASSAYGKYPLWVADYGVTSPQVPTPWTTFKIWQYSDSNGALDLDVFDGTLAELQAFARGSNAAPHGTLEAAACTGITGWAQDASTPDKAITVHLSFDGAAGAAGATLVSVIASDARTDLCKPLGSCNHGFKATVPAALLDGKPHQVFAYAVDSGGGPNVALADAPKSITCTPAGSDPGAHAGSSGAAEPPGEGVNNADIPTAGAGGCSILPARTSGGAPLGSVAIAAFCALLVGLRKRAKGVRDA